MSKPIIFLSFANSQDAHLPLLDSERQKIVECLLPLDDKDYFSLRHEPKVTPDILFSYLSNYRERIILFHYAGHASSDEIFLYEGSGRADRLAELLGTMPYLKLVFLNGCSTGPQVSRLLSAGVPAVIGTSSPVRDTLAVI